MSLLRIALRFLCLLVSFAATGALKQRTGKRFERLDS